MNKTLMWIIIILAILVVISFVIMIFFPLKTSAQKCYDDFNASFVKENSTMLYPDFVRGCCAKPVSQQAACLDQYSLLN